MGIECQVASVPGRGGRPVRAMARLGNRASRTLVWAAFAPLGLLGHPNARKLFLSVVVFGIFFPLGTQPGYREEAGSLGSLGGLPLSLGLVALIGLYVPLLLTRRRERPAGLRRLRHASLPLAAYVGFAVLSLLAASDVELGLYELFLMLQLLLLHVYLAGFLADGREVRFVCRLVSIGLVAEGVLMIGLAFAPGLVSAAGRGSDTLVDDGTVWLTRYVRVFGVKVRVDENTATGAVRVGGALGSPNDAAACLSAALMVALGSFIASRKSWDKRLALAALASGGVALLLTLSRGGWTALALGLAIVGCCVLGSRETSKRALVAMAFSFGMLGILFFGTISARVTGDDAGAAAARLPLVKLAGLIIEDHPLLGVGANNFPVAMEPYLTQGFSGEFVYAVHNKYLLVLSETGPGALLAFVWFLIAALRQGVRCWRYKHPVLSPVALGCVAALAGNMFHMMVDVFRGPPCMQLVCLAAGLIAATERLAAAAPRATGARAAATAVLHG